MKRFLDILFGARAQVIVGVMFLLAVAIQWFYWGLITPPTVGVVFHVSMEALAFAAYAIIATGLGYRATERVETAVVENIDTANNITVEGKE